MPKSTQNFDQPPLGVTIPSTFQSPKATDLFTDDVFVIVKAQNTQQYVPGVKGDPHPDTKKYPDHQLQVIIPDASGTSYKWIYTRVRDPLISYESTGEGLVDTITKSRVLANADKPALTALRVGVRQENLADGDAQLTITDEPSVFPANEYVAEGTDLVPPEFRDQVPLITQALTEAGIAHIPVLGPGEIRKSSEQRTAFRRRQSVTARDLDVLPKTLVDKELSGVNAHGSEFSEKFNIIKTLDRQDMPLEEGFDIISSKVEQLGAGLTKRTTERLATLEGARLELTAGGAGYGSAPAVVFDAGEVGHDAAGTPIFASTPGGGEPGADPGGTFPLNFGSNGDANGVFYFLGARYNGGTWRNPTIAPIGITYAGNASYPVTDASLATIVDRQIDSPSLTVIPDEGGGHYVALNLGVGRKLAANYITIRTRSSVTGDLHHHLRIQGYNDVVSGSNIGSITTPNTLNTWVGTALNDSVAYQHFRIFGLDGEIGNNDPRTWPVLSFDEIELYGTLTIVPAAGLNYVYNGDPNGVFYFLGRRAGAGTWTNPQTAGEIDCTADNIITGTVDGLVDRAPTNIIQDAVANRSYYFDLKAGKSLICNKVLFRQRTSFNAAAIHVQLQGTNTLGVTLDWTPLADFTTPTAQDTWKAVDATGSTPYRRFRLIGEQANFAIGECELYGLLSLPTGGGVATFSITGVTMTDGGTGYGAPPQVVFAGDGQDAAGVSTLVGGVVTGVTMTNTGSGYTTATVGFLVPGGGGGAAATAVIDGEVTDVEVVNNGSGYTSIPDVVFDSGTAAADAVLGYILDSIDLTNQGSGYSVAPDVQITPQNDAEAHAVLSYELDHISVTVNGSGYTSPPAVVIDAPTGANPIQATGTAVMGSGAPTTETRTWTMNGDDQGVFYRIGTTFGTVAWTNPHTSGAIVVGESSYGGVPSETVEQIVAHDATSDVYTDNIPNSYFTFDLGVGRTLQVTDWTYQSRFPQATQSTPTAMDLEGSNNGVTWTPIDSRTGIAFTIAADWRHYTTTSAAFRYFRLIQTAQTATSNDYFTIGEFELYGVLTYAGVVASDQVESITLDDPGFGYLVTPGVNLTGDGTLAAATAYKEALGSVDHIVIDDPGLDFETPPPAIVIDGDGINAAADATLAAAGRVIRVDITDPGTGYQTAPGATIQNGGGTLATLTTTIEGIVVSVTLDDAGGGYFEEPTVAIFGHGGTGATASLDVAAGLVTNLLLTAPGSGYNSAPDVIFTTVGGPTADAFLGFGVDHIALDSGGGGGTATGTLTTSGSIANGNLVVIGTRTYTFVTALTPVNGQVLIGGSTAIALDHLKAAVNLDTGNGTLYAAASAHPTVAATTNTINSQAFEALMSGASGNAIGTVAIGNNLSFAHSTLVDGGDPYTSPPVVHIAGPCTFPAQASATLGFPLDSVIMIGRGQGYTLNPAVHIGGDGTGGAGTAVRGYGVASTMVTNGGSGYLTEPAVVVSGGGSLGAEAAFAARVGRRVDALFLSTQGVGYTSTPTVIFTPPPGGTVTTAATAHTIRSFGVASITGGTGGTLYTTATVSIAAPTGINPVQATAHATFSAGAIASIVIDNPGFGYLAAAVPAVTITGDGSGASAATAVLATAGVIDQLILDTRGSGYSNAPRVTFSASGSSVDALATSTLDTTTAGAIVRIEILNAGYGYISPLSLTIPPGTSGGINAAGTATLSTSGSVVAVTLTNRGFGYTVNANVTIVGNGTGAVGTAIRATAGKVLRINLLNSGSGYEAAPTVTLEGGGGSGAFAHAVLNATGSVIRLVLTNPGPEYSIAPLVSFIPDDLGAAALYILPTGWPILTDWITDPVEGIVVQITKKIVHADAVRPVGYSDIYALDKWRSILIVSKIDLTTLPSPDIFGQTHVLSLPPLLVSVRATYGRDQSAAASIDTRFGSTSVKSSSRGKIIAHILDGYRGPAKALVTRVFMFGPPSLGATPEPLIITPSTGTAYITSRHLAANSSIGVRGGFGYTETGFDSSEQVDALDISGVLTGGFGTSSSSSENLIDGTSVSDEAQFLAQAAGMFIDPFRLHLANNTVSSHANLTVDIPASCPRSLTPGTTFLVSSVVEKWRFGVYVQTLTQVTIPDGSCTSTGYYPGGGT